MSAEFPEFPQHASSHAGVSFSDDHLTSTETSTEASGKETSSTKRDIDSPLQNNVAPTEASTILEKPPSTEERPHPLTIIAKTWISFAAVIIFLVREGADIYHDFVETGTIQLGRSGLIIVIGLSVLLVGSLVFGFFTWRFTFFVIDDDELRIERRFIIHSSNKIRFDRVQSIDVHQPFLSRFLGLAALRISVGASSATKSIEFLKRSRAYALRDYLLTRAHGQKTTVEESAKREVGDAFSEITSEDRILLQVNPRNLVIAALTSTEFILTFLFIGVVPLIGFFTFLPEDAAIFSLTPLVPLVFTVGGILWNRIIADWNFTLSRTGRGVRISKGLTTIASQSLPLNRVLAINITQSLLWRPLKLYRMSVNVLGYSFLDSDSDKPSSILLPAGTIDDVHTALTTIWPGFDLDSIELHRVPRRSRWLHPLTSHTIQWGFDDFAMVGASGLLVHNIYILPHTKMQSVAWNQGPLQRLLGLSTVVFHLPFGAIPLVDVTCLADEDGRWLTLTAPQRAYHARQIQADRSWLDELPSPESPFSDPREDLSVTQGPASSPIAESTPASSEHPHRFPIITPEP